MYRVAMKDDDMQLIGSFLRCASKGDKVGLNQMLMDGTSPDVQDYDRRTALHLACSEGHASIVELLIQHNANVNPEDRWQRTMPDIMDIKIYAEFWKCMEAGVPSMIPPWVNLRTPDCPAKFIIPHHRAQRIHHEHGLNDANIDPSELNLEHSSIIEQGIFGKSEKVKWRGTWVVKTIIKTRKPSPEKMKWYANEISRLRELRHPNILQFLDAIIHEDEIILITEYLTKGNLFDILRRKVRLDIFTFVRYALDIARGMNYLHQHKPHAFVHNYLCLRNLLQDEGGHLKIGEYWVQMLYEQSHPCQENCQSTDNSPSNPLCDTKRDICSFAAILYEMLEGCALDPNTNFDFTHLKLADFEPKFKLSRCPIRIQQLIQDCLNEDHPQRPTFATAIEILEEVSVCLARSGCPVC